MTTKTDAEKQKKEEVKAAPLKGALADVLKKSEPEPRRQEASKSPEPKPKQGGGPFEVPEETLRALFKDTK
jgi:hypothetical protein